MDRSSSLLELLDRAIALHRSGQFVQALQIYEETLKQFPGHAQTLYLCGLAYQAVKQNERAVDRISRAVMAAPTEQNFHVSLGLLLREQGQSFAAIERFTDAVRLNPADMEAHFHLGDLYMDSARLTEAIEQFSEVLRLDPSCVPAHINLGLCFKSMQRIEEALIQFRRAILLQPDNPQARVNHALTMLIAGDYRAGWQEYEWRFKLEEVKKYTPTLPQAVQAWDGELSALKNKRLLVLSEQGYGDNIQFIRYFPLLKEQGAELLFECPEALIPLLRQEPSIDRLVTRRELLVIASECDLYCHLLSLPRLFATTLETIPPVVNRGYIHLDAVIVEQWRSCIENSSALSGIKAGIVWQGKPLHKNDPTRYRSCPLPLVYPLADIDNVKIYSLQARNQGDNRHPSDCPFIDLADGITDFSHSAAILSHLDLLITIDTAAAHLAGAMGKMVWLLLPYAPDWRWGLTANKTPWYPSMTIFRQSSPGDWREPIQQIQRKLMTLARSSWFSSKKKSSTV